MEENENDEMTGIELQDRETLLNRRLSNDETTVAIKQTPGTSAKRPADENLAGDFKTFGNTIISFIGSGILGMPYAFSKAGLILGFVLLSFVSGVSVYSMILLIRCKYSLKKRNVHVTKYAEVAQIAYGAAGSFIVETCLVMTQAGFCVAYLIFISKNLHAMFNWSEAFIITICLPALTLISFLRHLKQLAPFALFADFTMLIGLAVVYINDFEYMPLDHDRIAHAKPENLAFFFGIATYCYEGIGLVLPIENSMRNKANFKPILYGTVGLVTCVYMTFGMCGYLAFGEYTKDLITLNMTGSKLASIVKLLLCVGLYFTYPMMIFPVFQVLEKYVLSSRSPSSAQVHKSRVFRGSLVIGTGIAALSIPNFGVFIAFIGSTGCSLLAFMLPAALYYKICRDDISIGTTIWLAVIFVIGILSMILGLKDAFEQLAQSANKL